MEDSHAGRLRGQHSSGRAEGCKKGLEWRLPRSQSMEDGMSLRQLGLVFISKIRKCYGLNICFPPESRIYSLKFCANNANDAGWNLNIIMMLNLGHLRPLCYRICMIKSWCLLKRIQDTLWAFYFLLPTPRFFRSGYNPGLRLTLIFLPSALFFHFMLAPVLRV